AAGPGILPQRAGEDRRHPRADARRAPRARLRGDAEPGELPVVPPRGPPREAGVRGTETAEGPGPLHELRRLRRPPRLRRHRRGDRPAAYPIASHPVNRTAHIHRQTAETAIELALDLDGAGTVQVATGIGFFDHIL